MVLPNTYKSIVTPAIALGVFITVLLIALLISGFCNPHSYDNTRTKVFISCLAGLGVFITFLFYYGIVSLQQAQQRFNIIEMTNHINKSLKCIIDDIHLASNQIPCFSLSLFPLIKQNDIIDEDCVENNILKTKLAYKIFALWQQVIIAVPFVEIDAISILHNFLQRAHSQELHTYWCDMKADFNKDTQLLGDLLFKHALNMETTSKSFLRAAKKISKDPLFYHIMKE